MQIRPAIDQDIADIQAIYAHHVLTGTGSFETVPPSAEEMADRLAAIQGQGWAWLVAADASGVLGFAHYAALREREAYRYTAEDSIYVRDDVRGQGVGKALVTALLEHAEARGFRQMIAVIGDAENVSSIGVHASLGFARVGVLKAVGWKHGRWLDVVLMQRALGAGDHTEPAGA
jgi:L-amino acid N-acyltransferase YncA